MNIQIRFIVYFLILLFGSSQHSFGQEENLEHEQPSPQAKPYDDSARGVFGRKIIKRNWKVLFSGTDRIKATGKIAVKICVDPKGIVKDAEILESETTEENEKVLRRAIKAAKGYRVEPDENAAPCECGKLVFQLDINAKRK